MNDNQREVPTYVRKVLMEKAGGFNLEGDILERDVIYEDIILTFEKCIRSRQDAEAIATYGYGLSEQLFF
ncbi:hypothetical protein ACFSQ7_40980 [Paenibacillus rhizoplanae]